MPHRRFTIRTVLAFLVVFGLVLSVARFAIYRHQGASRLDALIAGSQDVELTHWATEYQQRRLTCSDVGVLDYMTSAIRQARLDKLNSTTGISYEFEFRVSGGPSYALSAYVDTNRFSLAVPNADPIEGFWGTHDIQLHTPVPDRVREIFDFLNAPWEEVGGLALIVEDNQACRYEYDARLHMRNPPGSDVSRLTVNSSDWDP